jgi:hypothetical protein
MDPKNKKTPLPYKAPDGFFEAFPDKVMDALSRKPQAAPKKPLRLIKVAAIAASVALLTLVLYPVIQPGRNAPATAESAAPTDTVTTQNEAQDSADASATGIFADTPETYSAAHHASLNDLDQLLLELSDEELEALTADFLQDVFYQNPL